MLPTHLILTLIYRLFHATTDFERLKNSIKEHGGVGLVDSNGGSAAIGGAGGGGGGGS